MQRIPYLFAQRHSYFISPIKFRSSLLHQQIYYHQRFLHSSSRLKTDEKDKDFKQKKKELDSIQDHQLHPHDHPAPYNKPMGLAVEDPDFSVVKSAASWNLSTANISQVKDPSFKPKRVLVLSKTTRWETLSRKADHTKYVNEHSLRQKHEQQQAYINEICDQLKKRGVDVSVVKASDYTTEAIRNAQLVISAGGDGTFLTAASMIRDNTPCIGINTDPVGSEGHLCLLGKEHCDARDVIDRFIDGKFRFFPRHRIRVTLLNAGVENGEDLEGRMRSESATHEEHQQNSEVKFRSDDEEAAYSHPQIPTPLLALNEVFVGESHAARVSYLEIQIDDGEVYKQKNSGIIVCTGTGSTSWHYNINRLTEQNFTDIMQKMHDLGYRVEPPMDGDRMEELCQRYNERLVFAPDDKKMVYSIRDPVFNCTYPKIPHRGTVRRIRIKSKCSHAHLTLDGSTSIPFNHGAEVLIELHEEDALRTAILT